MGPDPYPDLHPDLRPLRFLIGTWEGGGEGDYPTVEPFTYRERTRFEDIGDAFIPYSLESWAHDDGAPLHLERGFLRLGPTPRTVELVLAHPLGLTEVSEGVLEGTTMELVSRTIGRTRTGSPVTGLARRYRVEGDVLHYELDMAVKGTPTTRHLAGELRRADP